MTTKAKNKSTKILPQWGSTSEESLPPQKADTLQPVVGLAGIAAYVNAELRRDTLRFEAAVTLAVGVTLQRHGIKEIRIYPNELQAFQQNFNAAQQLNEDGSFTINYEPK